MSIDLLGLWKLIPVVLICGAAYRFYRRQFLDIELHADSANSYCYVLDSERNTSKGKFWYYAHLKATVDISAGAGLGLEDVHFILKDFGEFSQVSFSSPHAPQSVQDFFGGYGKEWEVEDASGTRKTQDVPGAKSRLTARGVAQKGESFPNNPEYTVFMVLVLKRFLVLVPCSFASFRDGGYSTICGAARIHRRFGKQIGPRTLWKDEEDALRGGESLCRLQLAILDFDFVPWLSLFKAVPIKKERIDSRAGAQRSRTS